MTKLQLGKRPNLKPARNREKALNLIKLAEELDTYGARQIRAVELTKKLGNQCKPLGAWLRRGLIQEGLYSVEQQIAYTYRPNHEFVNHLRLLLGVDEKPKIEVAKEIGKLFIPCERKNAPRKGHRFYPWWSFMKKEKRREIFLAQFSKLYEFDIECARPTVLLQLYDRKLPEHLKTSDKHKVNTWRAYVQDRNMFRRQLSDDLGVPVEDIKELLQGVTNGAWASTSARNPFCRKIGQIKVHYLMKHDLYRGMREDLNTMWKVLFPEQPKKSIGKKMYGLYEPIEDEIMNSIEKFLKSVDVDGWFVHDGFFTYKDLCVTDIETHVFKTTNWSIKLEKKICGGRREGA